MRIVKQVRILLALAALGVAGVSLADVPAADAPKADPAVNTGKVVTVVIVGTDEDTWNCSEATVERARWLADKASRDGEYKRAGECYLAAGEPALADGAFMKAIGPSSADTSRKLAANLDQVKAQARQLKLAFQRR
jgi:hypothetical protein